METPVFTGAVTTAVELALETPTNIFDSTGTVIVSMLPSTFREVLDELIGLGYKVDIPALLPVINLTQPMTYPDLRRRMEQAFVRNAMEVEGLKQLVQMSKEEKVEVV